MLSTSFGFAVGTRRSFLITSPAAVTKEITGRKALIRVVKRAKVAKKKVQLWVVSVVGGVGWYSLVFWFVKGGIND